MRTAEKWTAEKIELLRRLYPSNLTKDISHIFGVSPKVLSQVAFRNGIRKDPEIKKLGTAAGQFKKGQSPFNKGKKWSEFMSEEGQRNSRKTQFKSTHIPFNLRPDWSERINVDGYIEIKIPGRRKWAQKHRWIWENAHGPVPKGCQIHFIDGNRMNCELSNLEMITHAENARRNSHWNNYPKEVASLIQLTGALNLQINKHKSNR